MGCQGHQRHDDPQDDVRALDDRERHHWLKVEQGAGGIAIDCAASPALTAQPSWLDMVFVTACRGS
jgi:hypothetical protein